MTEQQGKPRRLGFSLKLFGLVYIAGVAAQHLLSQGGGLSRQAAVVAGLLGFLAVMLAGLVPAGRRFFASAFFAVPGLVVLAVFSVMGTLILQNESAEAVREKYGWFATVIEGLFLGDVFHSLGFSAVLGMTAGGLGLVAARRRQRGVKALGSQLAHTGLLLVLAGAALGNVWGVKGRLDLHVGNSADAFLVETHQGTSRVPLGFSVRLEDFQVEHYQPDYQLMLFAVEGNDSERLFSAKAGLSTPELAGHGVEVQAYFPDYTVRQVVEPLADGDPPRPGENEAAEIELSGGKHALLLAGEAEDDVPGMLFFPAEERARSFLAAGAAAGAGPHVLVLGRRRVPVRIGDKVPLGDGEHQLEVVAAYLDFVIDPETRKPADRSSRPRNPALELHLLDASGKQVGRRFLFARYPDFHGAPEPGEGEQVGYEYLPSPTPPEAILVGEPRQLWLLSGWQAAKKVEPSGTGEFEWRGEKLKLAALHLRAARRRLESSASDEERNPLLRLEVAGRSTPLDLVPGKPQPIGAGKMAVLAPRGGEMVKDYFSTLAVFEEGREVERAVIEVNSPLSYGGFSFYQSSFRPEDPTYSGLQVVMDPGVWVAYLGFAVNFAGVFCALWLVRLRRKAGAPARQAGAEGGHD